MFTLIGCNRIPTYPDYIELKEDLILEPPPPEDPYSTTSSITIGKGTKVYYKKSRPR